MAEEYYNPTTKTTARVFGGTHSGYCIEETDQHGNTSQKVYQRWENERYRQHIDELQRIGFLPREMLNG